MPVCPSCFSKKMKKRDFYHYKGESHQRWQCLSCGFTTAYPLARKPMKRRLINKNENNIENNNPE